MLLQEQGAEEGDNNTEPAKALSLVLRSFAGILGIS